MVKISIKRRETYGVSRIYVCENAYNTHISNLTGQKTLTESQVSSLKALGIEVFDCDKYLQDTLYNKKIEWRNI